MNELETEKKITINGTEFTLHRYSAMDGRMIVSCYPLSAMSAMLKDNESITSSYEANAEVARKLLAYVSSTIAGQEVRLTTDAIINEACKHNVETLIRLELESLKFNCSFLSDSSFESFGKSLSAMLHEKLTQAVDAAIKRVLGSYETDEVDELLND